MSWKVWVALLCISTSPAMAQDLRADLGTLTCSVGLIVEAPHATDIAGLRSTRDILCSFKSLVNGTDESYIGTLQSVDTFEQRVVMWLVQGPFNQTGGAGLLVQTFSQERGAPLGASPASLVGDANQGVVLQPVQGQALGRASNIDEALMPMHLLVTLTLKAAPS